MLQDAGIDQSQQQRRADADHDGALAQGPLQPSLLPSLARRWRLPHLMIAANACQLVLMIAFLALLLARLKESFVGSWFFVFIPLWGSDAITFVAGVIEMRRLLRADTDPTTHNQRINQFNRLKGCLCVAAFKTLLCLNLDELLPSLSARLICTPYYVAAVLRLVLHFCKTPLQVPLPRHTVCGRLAQSRPGTPINPVHIMVILISCRVDQTFYASWAVTLSPLWMLFSVLGFLSIGVGCLALSILLVREPNQQAQRTLFFLCFCILITITTTGSLFLLSLTRRLDVPDAGVTYEQILVPLLAGYSVLLLCYLTFTTVLPRLLLNDQTAVGLEHEADDAEEEDGVLELVSQHLAPPLLVKQSSTLFKRLNAPAMFDAVVGKGLAGLHPVQEGPGASTGEFGGLSASGVASGAPFSGRSAREECVAQDVEEGRGGTGGVGGQDGGRGKGFASWAEGADVTASADAPTCGSGCYAGNVLTDRSEYIQLQADIEQWVGEQRELPLGTPKGRPVAQQQASAKEPAVPEDIKRKLQRFAALKRKLAQAAFAHAGYLVDPCLDGNGGADCPADGGRGWAGRPAANAEPGACGESASPSPPAPALAVEIHGIPECPEGDKHQPPADTPGGCPGPASPREAAAARAHAGRAAGLPPDSQSGLPQAVVVDTYAAAAVIDRAEASAGTAAQPSGCLPSKRVGSLDEQSRAPAADTAAGEPIGEGTGLGSSSEGDGDSSDRPEGAEDKCWICYEGPRDAVLLECGHGGMCVGCAKRLFRKKGRICPMCRQPVTQMVQLRLDAARESGGPASLGIVPVLPAELPVEWLDDLGAETGADRCATSE
mmetsp:Transcript_6118/g.20106  ORF Transcript_6118/g.20106 Transcript_6118/m.20106 type:complete len:832 (-) Transcript_6118:192-2687(-)